jgi:hypothetical protein
MAGAVSSRQAHSICVLGPQAEVSGCTCSQGSKRQPSTRPVCELYSFPPVHRTPIQELRSRAQRVAQSIAKKCESALGLQVVLMPPQDVVRARLEARWKTGQACAA